ncbi:MAG: hypothetical protein JXM75_12355 [Chromatiaceae bacterium]|nr:hypothetical protein [Chromatiaceae bacterium]
MLVVSVQAGESRIELIDGSVLTGELRAVESGRYWIRSATLGDLSVPEERVRSVTPLAATSSGAPIPGFGQADLAAIQQQIASNPDLMKQVMALQNDSDLQAILADSALTQRAMAGNLESLGQDPRIRRLLEKPEIRALMEALVGE